MKRDADFFEEKEPVLLYIAKKLKDALALEQVLTEAGVDYGVEPDRYRGGFIFQTERIGAFFYVREETVETARQTLTRHGYRRRTTAVILSGAPAARAASMKRRHLVSNSSRPSRTIHSRTSALTTPCRPSLDSSAIEPGFQGIE